jgi:hypothetical protein
VFSLFVWLPWLPWLEELPLIGYHGVIDCLVTIDTLVSSVTIVWLPRLHLLAVLTLIIWLPWLAVLPIECRVAMVSYVSSVSIDCLVTMVTLVSSVFFDCLVTLVSSVIFDCLVVMDTLVTKATDVPTVACATVLTSPWLLLRSYQLTTVSFCRHVPVMCKRSAHQLHVGQMLWVLMDLILCILVIRFVQCSFRNVVMD